MRWHGSSFCSIKGRAGHYFGLGSVPTLPAKFTQTEIMPRAVYWLFRKVCEQCTRIYVCVMGWDVV